MTEPTYELEHIYDEQIAPLMEQIIAICKQHQMPMIASFAYRCDEDGGYDLCTACLPGQAEHMPRSFIEAIDVLYTPGTEIDEPPYAALSA